MKQIIKACLKNVIAACIKYKVPFDVLLTEISYEHLRKVAENERKGNRI